MADWFSDQYSAGSAATAIADPITVVSSGVNHGRKRIIRAEITVTDTAAADILRMFTLKSGDRLYTLELYTDGGCNASSSSDVGIHTSTLGHDSSTALDADVYATTQDLTSALDVYTEVFTQATTLGGEDRGKTIWEQLAVGAQSYTVDPLINVDFTITLNGEDDATSTTIVLIGTYVSH